jgi:hypothetical protein
VVVASDGGGVGFLSGWGGVSCAGLCGGEEGRDVYMCCLRVK